MMASENLYTDLIAGAHSGKPKFQQLVYELTEPLRIARERLAGMRADFDLDYAAGDQLDALGVRIGLSRNLKIRISDAFFAFDDDGGPGFDLGIWFEPYMSAYGITRLPDGIYRACLKAKVALNHYRGTNEGLDAFLSAFAEAFGLGRGKFSYIDGQDMTIRIGVSKSVAPPVFWQLLENGILPINHAGVRLYLDSRVQSYLTTTDGVPMTDDSKNYLVLEAS